jgi:glycine/D-amino acid oxidase-like deaminating enzyme
VATNAFTPSIFPQLKEDILCYTSQIANWEHIKHKLGGLTVTEHEGDIYYNFPKSMRYMNHKVPMGMLHFGLDDGRIVDPESYERREYHLQKMIEMVHERFSDTQRQPPSRCWSGPIAITMDRTPMIGFFDCGFKRKDKTRAPLIVDTGVVLAVAFQGFGGSFCFHAGYAAAYMALTGQNHPDVPPDIFSPHRFDEMSKEAKLHLEDSVNRLGYSCYLRNIQT